MCGFYSFNEIQAITPKKIGGKNLLQKRYTDTEKLITNSAELKITEDAEVLIYSGDKWYDEVFVDLNGKEQQFEELKPHIAYIAEHLCEMDLIAQKYSALHGDSEFVQGYEIAYVYLDGLDKIRLLYYGMIENTEFYVVFSHVKDKFLLQSFGMQKNIPSTWEKQYNKAFHSGRIVPT